jgi:hypothetical protein
MTEPSHSRDENLLALIALMSLWPVIPETAQIHCARIPFLAHALARNKTITPLAWEELVQELMSPVCPSNTFYKFDLESLEDRDLTPTQATTLANASHYFKVRERPVVPASEFLRHTAITPDTYARAISSSVNNMATKLLAAALGSNLGTSARLWVAFVDLMQRADYEVADPCALITYAQQILATSIPTNT